MENKDIGLQSDVLRNSLVDTTCGLCSTSTDALKRKGARFVGFGEAGEE